MQDKINRVKDWLGTGSIDIFGLPFAGKDTQALRLANYLGANMIGSGDILRHQPVDSPIGKLLAAGEIIPSEMFYEVVLPYLSRDELSGKPLVLSSVGRSAGEEYAVIDATNKSGHQLKAVVMLDMPETEVWHRFDVAQKDDDRGNRTDDKRDVLDRRLSEFRNKTLPVINFYRDNNLLLNVDGSMTRDEVTEAIVDALFERATTDR